MPEKQGFAAAWPLVSKKPVEPAAALPSLVKESATPFWVLRIGRRHDSTDLLPPVDFVFSRRIAGAYRLRGKPKPG
ncbi:hypothetical protein [Sinorhizobium fredii]|uniref:hypothetical protein n=1 Tax=Rhizobium fredii TaxID=380 RepID=UPI0004BC771F|nr:hypothetical protein [Sinorhizobium fredii]AWI56779.1 hypothetical protein AB395_00001110 [Sinorhizobium fredii CCBAU 45436]